MQQFTVTGMSCAACSARVEKAVSKVEGVSSVSVSLLTNSMGVEGSASDADIIKAVTDAGYGASVKGDGAEAKSSQALYDEEALADHETPALKKRLIASLGFLAVLMYFSMGHMMWGWPIPAWFMGNHVAMGLLQMLLAGIIMVINQKFFVSGFKGLINRAPNMDTLVAMGSMASFAWSVYVLFAMTDAVVKGQEARVMDLMMNFYFESAAMILTLITVGKMLEARSKGRTTDALKGLMKLAPKTAVLLKNGSEVTVPIEQVKKDDIFVVRPGESIPVDGVIVDGSTAVDEAALTGESIPVDKAEGDMVSAATINQSGFITCQATRVGEDTTLSQIIKMVSDAAATKAPIAKIADKVAGVFVPAVITIAVITTIIWLAAGQSFGYALARGISVLVISCPCSLGLATPVAIMVGNGMGAKNGILFKTSASLEETGRVQIVALDKTGTITCGEPVVTDIIPAEGVTQEELVKAAASLEAKSEHPLARAVMKKAEELQIKAEEVSGFKALAGNGLTATLGGVSLTGGSMKYMSETVGMSGEMLKLAEDKAGQGKTPLLFAENGRVLGIIAVADTIKEDSPAAIAQLRNMGIRVIMLTGDNERTANAIGEQSGVDHVIAGVLPDGKEAVIRSLQEFGKVAMVGDGINDAPALTRADIGIAIGAGTDVAIDAADVVAMKSSLTDVAAAIRLSRATLVNIHQNLFWAFFYNTIGIPLAAGLFIPVLGWELNPMFGALAMSLSSFCVVSNALRLNLFKVMSPDKDKKLKEPVDLEKLRLVKADVHEAKTGASDENAAVPENAAAHCDCEPSGGSSHEGQIKKIMKIEGMMCGHCEATVKDALESLEGVVEAIPSHEQDMAVVWMSTDVADEILKKAVEDEDYEVIEIS